MKETVQIKSLCAWNKGKRVETRRGPRILKTAIPKEEFFEAWRSSKEALKEAGVFLTKDGEHWVAKWWNAVDQTPAEKEKARLAEEKKTQDIERSRATDADIDLPSPEGLDFLPYQRAGISYGIDRKAVLIGDEMGLGKTIQGIGIWNADESLKKCLVICPASLRLNWKKEFEKWTTRPARVEIVNGGDAKNWPDDFDVLVINYDILSKHKKTIDAARFDLVIIDEAHYLKNPKTARTANVFGRPQKTKAISKIEFDRLSKVPKEKKLLRIKEGKNGDLYEKITQTKIKEIKARRRVVLTGTPIENRPVELFPLIQYLDPEGLGKDFFNYARRYCDGHRTAFGWDFTGSSNLEELQTELRSRFMIRRLKKDVLKDLPSKRRQVIEIQSSNAAVAGAIKAERDAFKAHEETLANLAAYIELAKCEESPKLELEAREKYEEAKGRTIQEMTADRLEVAKAKAAAVIEHVESALEQGPVVLFAHHKEVVSLFMDHFGDRAGKITGDVPMKRRQEVVEDFQSGKIDLFVGNIKAAGVGLTLTRSAHVIFAELDWTPGALAQAEDRCHRIGQVNSVLVQHVVLEGSLDSYMAKNLVAKQAVIEKALDTHPTPEKVLAAVAEAVEPPTPSKIRKVQITRDEIHRKSLELTEDQIAAAHAGMRAVAALCDGARDLDGMGFSGCDAGIGHSLAGIPRLTPRQAVLAVKLCRKYRRQIGEEIVERATLKKDA